MAKVSVIIPVYNAEKYLKRCLDSIVNQTFKDIEILCINDGSTDNSLNILNEYAKNDSRIRIINQDNQGVSITRNNGIKAATSKYISFVDSDDYISLDFLEYLIYYIEKYNADIAYCSLSTVRNDEIRCYYQVDNVKVYDTTNKKYKACNIPYNCHVPNKIYNREKLIKANLFFEPYVTYEDMEFQHKALDILGKLVTVPKSTYYYVNRNDSIVNDASDRNIKMFDKAKFKCLDYCFKNKIKIFHKKHYYSSHTKIYRIFKTKILTISYYDTNNFCWLFNIPLGNLKIFNRKGSNTR